MMASTVLESHWISLARIVNDRLGFNTVYDVKHNLLYAIKHKTGIYRYQFETDSWIKHIVPPSYHLERFIHMNWKPATLHSQQQQIFINHKLGSIAILSLDGNNQSSMQITNRLYSVGNGYGSKGIMINNEFHIIGGINSKHIKYNPKTKTVHFLHNMNFVYPEIVRIRNKVLIFGGEDPQNRNHLDSIHEYDIIRNEWHKLNCKIPKALSGCGCTSILNGQCVVLFGGASLAHVAQDDVFIYSVCDKIFSKSKMKCPRKGRYQAIAVKDRHKDGLVALNFIRCSWKNCGIEDHLLPSEDLIGIICGYYWNEHIHIFKSDLDSGYHFRIDVFKLLALS